MPNLETPLSEVSHALCGDGLAHSGGLWRECPSVSQADEDQIALRHVAATGSALCTVVGIDGSFSRRLGAQVAVDDDGRTLGSLSDGCLEKELASQALRLTGQEPRRMLRYGRGSPIVDFRLPCGSGLDILVDREPDCAAAREAVALLDARRPAVLRLPHAALRERAFIPSIRLLVCGSGPEAEWLGRLALSVGMATRVIGPGHGLVLHRPPDLRDVDAWTAVALLFHDHEWEQGILERALATPAFYIGAMGGRVARERRRSTLLSGGASESQVARIRSPIGLIGRARDPRLLALSVLSELAGAYECLRPTAP